MDEHYVTIDTTGGWVYVCYGTQGHAGGDSICRTDEAPGLESGVYRLVKVSD